MNREIETAGLEGGSVTLTSGQLEDLEARLDADSCCRATTLAGAIEI